MLQSDDPDKYNNYVNLIKENSTVRMISARLATVPEKKRYNYGEDEF